MPVAQLTKSPSKLAPLCLCADGITDAYPAAPCDTKHQESVSPHAEEQVFIPEQGEISHRLRRICGDRGRSFQLVRRWSRWFRRRSEEHTSELQSLMRISYAVFCLQKKQIIQNNNN